MNLNQRVKLDRSYWGEEFSSTPDITGTIVGVGSTINAVSHEIQPIYIVKLDQGFYSPCNRIYVVNLTVDTYAVLPID
jgi:hypothetical protein